MRVYKIVSFSVVILLITVLFAGLTTIPATAQPDTMQFRYNAEHTGDYSAVAGNNPPNNHLGWKLSTGGGQSTPVVSSPAVVNGVVYMELYGVYAINAATGTKLWQSGAFAGAYSPAIANGVVYIGSTSGLYALNANDGGERWNYTTGSIITSSPTVANGVVYVGGGDLYAINANDGTKLWNYTDADSHNDFIFSPAVVNGVVYVGSSSPYSPANTSFYAFDAATGAKLWQDAGFVREVNYPTVANGLVYFGSSDGKLYALNANDGGERWNYTIGLPVDSSASSIAVVNGVVYVGSADRNVYALNAATGAKLWNYTTGSNVASSPAVANGVVYVGSDDNNLYALNANDGTKLWNYTTGFAVSSSPAVVNGVVYVGSSDGNLYAIGNAAAATSQAATSQAATSQGATPGFEVMFAFVGLVIAAYIVRRRS